MILKILSPEKDWQFIEDELDKVISDDLEIDFDLQYLNIQILPRQEYMTGKYGINKVYLNTLMKNYQGEITLLHTPDFKVEGAGGWFSYVNRKPFIQAYGRHDKKFSRTGEFVYWMSELIVHEISHKLYFKLGLQDKTHYWHYEKGKLTNALKEIKIHLLKKKVSLLEQLIILTRKVFVPKHKEEDANLYVVHHSATARDYTRGETIINNQPFYNFVIDKDGKLFEQKNPKKSRDTIDICVIGDFTKEEPTVAQIAKLKKTLGPNWTTHHELGKKGQATKSECPGKLIQYL
jgi:hypothetical protein